MDIFLQRHRERGDCQKHSRRIDPVALVEGRWTSSPKLFQMLLRQLGRTSYNTQASLKDEFLSYPGGKTDWLGMDDGTRSLPSEWQEGGIQSQELIDATRSGGGRTDASRDAAAEELIRLTKAFEPVMRPSENTSGLDHSFNVSVGDTKKVGGRDLGFLFGLNYDRDYSFYANGITGRHMVSDAGVDTDLYLQDTRGIEEVSWGNLATLAYKISDHHTIGFNFLFNHSSEDEARIQQGFLQSFEDSHFNTSVLHYTIRELRSMQFKGDHSFPELLDLKSNWVAAFSSTSQDEPDLRFFLMIRISIPIVSTLLYQATIRRPATSENSTRTIRTSNGTTHCLSTSGMVWRLSLS